MWTPRLRDLFDLEYLHRFAMLITNFNGMIMIFGGSSLGAGAFSVMLSALKYITGLNFQYCDARWGFFGTNGGPRGGIRAASSSRLVLYS